jgi:predicted HTH domain antitoxin
MNQQDQEFRRGLDMAKNSKVKKIKPKKKKKLKLSLKQQRLVDKYEGKGTLRQAAEYAGLSFGYARKVIAKRHVKVAIKAKQRKLQKKVEVDQAWLLMRHKKLVDYKITDFFNDDGHMKPLSEIPEDAIYAICGLDVSRKTANTGENSDVETTFINKFKLADKKGSLVEIAKILGLNVEKGGLNLGDDVTEVRVVFVGKKDKDAH